MIAALLDTRILITRVWRRIAYSVGRCYGGVLDNYSIMKSWYEKRHKKSQWYQLRVSLDYNASCMESRHRSLAHALGYHISMRQDGCTCRGQWLGE